MDEEYELILVELSGIIDGDFLHTCDEKCRVLGIDSKTPILQLGNYVFEGEYDSTLGTAVFFEEVPSEKAADGIIVNSDGSISPQSSQPVIRNMKLYDMARKKLKMERIFLSKRNTKSESEEPKSETEEPKSGTEEPK